MTGVIQDITEVLVEGTEDLSRMAFDKPYQEVFEDFALIDAKVEKHDSRQDQSDKRDLLLLQSHVGSMNNPLNFLTPILIVSIIIIAILATVCICAMGFCWYVRYSKKQERRLGNQPPDPENNTNNGNISMNNVNEESIQFINNVYKDWKRSESMRSGSRHSRRDREEVMSSETQRDSDCSMVSNDFQKAKSRPCRGSLSSSSRGPQLQRKGMEKRTSRRGNRSERNGMEREKQQRGEAELGVSISDLLHHKAKKSKDKLHRKTVKKAQTVRLRANERVERVKERSRHSMRKRINRFLAPLGLAETQA